MFISSPCSVNIENPTESFEAHQTLSCAKLTWLAEDVDNFKDNYVKHFVGNRNECLINWSDFYRLFLYTDEVGWTMGRWRTWSFQDFSVSFSSENVTNESRWELTSKRKLLMKTPPYKLINFIWRVGLVMEFNADMLQRSMQFHGETLMSNCITVNAAARPWFRLLLSSCSWLNIFRKISIKNSIDSVAKALSKTWKKRLCFWNSPKWKYFD